MRFVVIIVFFLLYVPVGLIYGQHPVSQLGADTVSIRLIPDSVHLDSEVEQPQQWPRKRHSPAADSIYDDAIMLPESLENDVDSLLTDWFVQTYAHRDSSCVSQVDNIVYPDSVYRRRLEMLPAYIEMPYNSVVRQFIDLYTGRRRELVEYMLGLGVYYFPIFEQELEKNGLPLELKYLPIIESALNPKATSRAGAAGLWQFMLPTAKLMGLEVNSLVDERRDPYKSSAAAARYLKELYDIYQDWNLVIAAYNCGPGTVNKAIRRAGGKRDYWEIYYYLPRETRSYVPLFIAANYVMTYYNEHNICPVQTDFTTSIDTVELNRPYHMVQISEVLKVPIEQIRDLNPHYRRDIIPGDSIKSRSLCLPSQYIYAFIEEQDSIVAYKADSLQRRSIAGPLLAKGKAGIGTAIYYKIKNGDTLSTIARKHRVSIKDLKEWNNLKNSKIRAGKTLIIYN